MYIQIVTYHYSQGHWFRGIQNLLVRHSLLTTSFLNLLLCISSAALDFTLQQLQSAARGNCFKNTISQFHSQCSVTEVYISDMWCVTFPSLGPLIVEMGTVTLPCKHLVIFGNLSYQNTVTDYILKNRTVTGRSFELANEMHFMCTC